MAENIPSNLVDLENDDPFSSFIIHPDPKLSIQSDTSTREKLQARRKVKNHVDGSPNISTSCYKLIVKYGGYFKPISNGAKEKYYSGKQKTIYLEEASYSVEELFEVTKFYLDDETCKLSLLFVDKRVSSQSFIQIEDDRTYKLMLSMYAAEKKAVIYVTAQKIIFLEDGERVDEIVETDMDIQGEECSCRAWQVKGVPCVHAAVFISSFRNANWEKYVDPFFTVTHLRAAYANGIPTMLNKDEWLDFDLGYKMLPPTLNRPPGRPRMNRIKPSDEPNKRSHKCSRCGQFGHHGKKMQESSSS